MKIVFSAIVSITVLLVPATKAQDAANGQRIFARCKACHTIEKGGPNRVGPNLYGVFGRKIASHEGFRYSEALSSIDGIWDEENLNQWLMSPRIFARGTRMTFAGLRREEERADLIAWLKANSDTEATETASQP